MKKTKLPPQALVLLVVLGLFVLGGLAYMLVVSPQKSKAAELKKQTEATQQKLTEYQQQRSSVHKVEPVRVADLYRLSKAMPESADMADVLLELSQQAADTGITFSSITPQTSVAQTGYQVLPITLTFEGNFYSLADLLYRVRNLVTVRNSRLEGSGRLFTIDSVAFAEAPEGFPQIQATLTVDAYVYGTGAPAQSATAPTGTTGTTGTTTTGSTSTTAGSTTTAATTTAASTTAGATP